MSTYVEIAGYRFPARVSSQETETSVYSGQDLRHITARVTHDDENAHEEILEAISTTNEPLGKLFQDGAKDDADWRVSISQWSSSSRDRGSTTYRYTVELDEVEEYTVDTLIVEDLEFDIIAYEEQATGSSLSVDFVGEIGQGDIERYFELWEDPGAYFKVVREGVDESPRSMRFGRSVWSEHGRTYKVKAVLVDASYDDEGPGSGFLDLAMIPNANARKVLAQQGAMMSNLLETLADKGVLSEQDVEDVRAVSENDSISRQLFRFYCVDDAEEFGPEAA